VEPDYFIQVHDEIGAYTHNGKIERKNMEGNKPNLT
jgi:hypothetical protein